MLLRQRAERGATRREVDHRQFQVQRKAGDGALRAATLAVVLLTAGAALFSACGSSSGGDTSTSPNAASPSAAPSPLRTYSSGQLPKGARGVLALYLYALWAQDADGARKILTPASPLRDDPLMGIVNFKGGTVHGRLIATPPPGTSAIVMVTATVEGEPGSAWGPAGRRDFFVAMTQLPDGSWRVDHMATGP